MIAAFVRPLVDDPRGGPWLLLAIVWLLVLLLVASGVVLGGVLVLELRRRVWRAMWRALLRDPDVVAIAFVVDAPGGALGGRLLDGVAPPGLSVEVVAGRGIRRLVKP
jgi:hypothetical protein